MASTLTAQLFSLPSNVSPQKCQNPNTPFSTYRVKLLMTHNSLDTWSKFKKSDGIISLWSYDFSNFPVLQGTMWVLTARLWPLYTLVTLRVQLQSNAIKQYHNTITNLGFFFFCYSVNLEVMILFIYLFIFLLLKTVFSSHDVSFYDIPSSTPLNLPPIQIHPLYVSQNTDFYGMIIWYNIVLYFILHII